MSDNVIIHSSCLSGEINIPPSKSISHRAIICAALADGISTIHHIQLSKDIEATLEAVKAFGASIEYCPDSSVKIKGGLLNSVQDSTIDCKESGSTLRFLIPLAALVEASITFTGEGRLPERPLDSYYALLDEHKVKYENNHGKLPLTISGTLQPGHFSIEGNISSQYITGLLIALPLLKGDSSLIITGDLESKGYVDLTLDVLASFGIKIINKDYQSFFIEGNQRYLAKDYTVESDYSQAAFWIVAGLIGNGLTLQNINFNSKQGDRAILDIVKQMGGEIIEKGSSLVVLPSSTSGITIDVSQIPDLVPILSVLGSVSSGTTHLMNGARLRIKESDRLTSTATELSNLGAEIMELDDSLIIKGQKYLTGGLTDSWNDHRIAMAIAVASIRCRDSVGIEGSQSVEKSYPGFWEDFKRLGGNIDEFEHR
ncbi:MAG: 3-phosphoshikimate 1-carboxyvinyltransferase [Peptostreptococcales bacterium]